MQLKVYGGIADGQVISVADIIPPLYYRVPFSKPVTLTIEDYDSIKEFDRCYEQTYRIAEYQLYRQDNGSLCYMYTGETR